MQIKSGLIAILLAASTSSGYALAAKTTAAAQTPTTENYLPYLPGLLSQREMVAPAKAMDNQARTYILPATPNTAQWGVFDSKQDPVLTINPGDSVSVETMAASDNQVVPGATIDQIIKIQNAVPNRGPHTLTGPIYLNGAEPGDVVAIHFNKILPRSYASNNTATGKGLFPNEFPKLQVRYFYLDVKNKVMQFMPGIKVPLAPFPGIVAVARDKSGKYDSAPPGRFGGNLDLREMTEGTTLYLPVFVKGALIWTGDSHAGQGNGEIDLTAIETAFQELNITVNLIKKQPLDWPRIETPSTWIAVGYDKDLNKALDILKQQTIKMIAELRNISPEQAKQVLYDNWNCPIAEVVNGVQGIYCIVPKSNNAKAYILPASDNDEFYVTTAKNADIEAAMKEAAMAMLKKISITKNITLDDAYVLSSLALDCRVAPHQTGDKEIHCMMPKNLWTL